MVQSVNTKAILTLASVLRRPALMIPHVSVETISELDFEGLYHHAKVKAVVFDKDNTLTGPYENAIHPRAQDGLASAIQTFGQDKVAILSNSAGTYDDPGYEDALAIEEALGIPVIRHKEKKPGGLPEVLQHFGLADASSIAMVGDRALTDVVFGNLHGMITIHTMPLCRGKDYRKDNWTASLLRPLENRIVYGRVGRLWKPPIHKHWDGTKSLVHRK